MVRAKPLSIPMVDKQHQANFGKLKRVNLSNGHYVDVHEKFKTTDCQRLVVDYQETLERLKAEGTDAKNVQEILFVYYMLLLKYFTSLGDVIPLEVHPMVVVCGKLLDLGLLEEILDAFPKEELEKLSSFMQKVEKNAERLGNQIRLAQNEGYRHEN